MLCQMCCVPARRANVARALRQTKTTRTTFRSKEPPLLWVQLLCCEILPPGVRTELSSCHLSLARVSVHRVLSDSGDKCHEGFCLTPGSAIRTALCRRRRRRSGPRPIANVKLRQHHLRRQTLQQQLQPKGLVPRLRIIGQ